MKYKIEVETLNHQYFQYEVKSNLSSENLMMRIFNQTPNVRGVTVAPVKLAH